MRPLSLRLDNFQSYRGPHELDLHGINLAILSGPNGAGKSSIIDAIRYALWGYARAGADSVVTEGENVGRVEFEFALGADHYLVSRQRNRKGGGGTALSFQSVIGDILPHGRLNNIVLDGKTVGETQASIEHVLRMTDDLFTQTACANQGNAAAFSQARPADRKRVLGDILDLAAWERRAEAARQASREAQGRIDRASADIQAAQTEAAKQPDIEAQIATNAERIAYAERDQQGIQADLATVQEQRVAAIALRDGAVRKSEELQEAQGRWRLIESQVNDRAARLRNLQQVTADRVNVEQALAQAIAAAERAEELADAQRQAQEIAHEEKLIVERAATAKREHEAEIARVTEALRGIKRDYSHQVQALDTEVAHIREVHLHRVAQLDDQHERLARQAEVLDEVPCANPVDEATRPSFFAIRDKCPLIAQAREAVAQIGAVYADLTAARAAAPWAERQAELDALRGQASQIGAPEAARLALLERDDPLAQIRADSAALAARRAALGYVAGTWEEARREADKRPALEIRMREIEVAAAQAAELQAALDEARRAAADLGERVAQIQSEMLDPAAIQRKLSDVDAEIHRCETALVDLRTTISRAQAQAGALHERLEAARRDARHADELLELLETLERRRQLLDLLGNPRSGAFSRSGIPALLIDQAVPELEAAANEVLRELSDGRMSVALHTQRETQAKTLSETLEIIVADERGERPYETFSGGEAMRVDLGLRIGLSRLLAARAGARCEMLVMDETAAPLDADGRRLFVQCLGRVAERFACVLCISHVEELKDLFPAQIAVSKGDGGSRLEVLR